MIYRTQNPHTEIFEKLYDISSETTTDTTLRSAESASLVWSAMSFSERAVRIRALADGLLRRKDEFAAVMAREMGKPIGQGLAEIEKSAVLIEFYAAKAESFLSPEIIPSESSKSYACFDSLGVVFGIMPWNFPFWQVLRFAVPAWMAGNAAVFKPAPIVPECAVLLTSLCREFEVPLWHLFLEEKATAQVMTDPRISVISFTGSVRTGKLIAARAGLNMKKGVYELGGSDPYLVLEDADVSRAASICASSRLINSGQSCVAAKRFLVHRSLKKSFEEAFVAAMNVSYGDPLTNPALGPLARPDIRIHLADQVRSSVSQGAKLLLGGEIPDQKGYYFPPTVLTDLSTEMAVWDEETFGPVAALHYFDSDEQAIALANDSDFGLAAAVFTADSARGESVALKLKVGSVSVNDLTRSDPRFPFGGIKDSGMGRELGSFGIREFTNIKTVKIA
ncbi:MAG TPA: aldehyde dehydrogenase family protein [Leptospiraceae bacterium]|nr:aldehyde dehydrogenase family protein [Leptospirales bacterium]HMU82224.1 aldehyde dehydrogenase family protein [Leptospiraceae bacterium]HMW59129.1 aldehyde dehydrogenase family protein [Leptospiraceae bacterium]HMX57448.1 aldehyde dehydrogenase family protein [Leptospiraceae bacterium]HNL67442.1 aldehyde dehydrogenase family protein [Leptospiraceae bacterium]